MSSGVLSTTLVLLDVNVPWLKMPPPCMAAWFRVTRLLLIDKELAFQIQPPSLVATLPLMVLPSIAIGPRFAKTPPPSPSPVVRLPLMVLSSIVMAPRFPKTPPPNPFAGSSALLAANALSLMVLPPLTSIGPLRTELIPAPAWNIVSDPNARHGLLDHRSSLSASVHEQLE